MSIESVMPSNHLILCRPLLLPASGSFQMSQLFASGDFLDIRPKGQPMKKLTDKLDFIQIKHFCSVEKNVKKIRK